MTTTLDCGASQTYPTGALLCAHLDGLNALADAYEVLLHNDGTFSGSSFATPVFPVAGFTTDATNNLTIKCAPGDSFIDHVDAATNDTLLSQTKGVLIEFTGGFACAMDIAVDYVTVEGLQIIGNGAFNGALQCDQSNFVFRNSSCVHERGIYTFQRGTWSNILWVNWDLHPLNFNSAGSPDPNLHGCTFALAEGIDGTGFALVASVYGTLTLTNTAIFVDGGSATTGTISASGCMTDQASPPAGFATVVYADQFVDSAFANNLRLVSTADMVNGGVTDASFATDFLGRSRPQDTDYCVGWEEYVSPIPPAYARPASDVTDGGWTNEAGSATNLYASIDETVADADDFIQSAVLAPGQSDTSEVALSPLADPGVHTDHKVNFEYYMAPAEGVVVVDLTVALVEDTTVIASLLIENIGPGLTAGTLTLTSGEAAAITDYTDLRLRFTAAARV